VVGKKDLGEVRTAITAVVELSVSGRFILSESQLLMTTLFRALRNGPLGTWFDGKSYDRVIRQLPQMPSWTVDEVGHLNESVKERFQLELHPGFRPLGAICLLFAVARLPRELGSWQNPAEHQDQPP
jgi:hypothetical protein